jgi:hypothetical protein
MRDTKEIQIGDSFYFVEYNVERESGDWYTPPSCDVQILHSELTEGEDVATDEEIYETLCENL